MGVDGFYFDEYPQPPGVRLCLGELLKTAERRYHHLHNTTLTFRVCVLHPNRPFAPNARAAGASTARQSMSNGQEASRCPTRTIRRRTGTCSSSTPPTSMITSRTWRKRWPTSPRCAHASTTPSPPHSFEKRLYSLQCRTRRLFTATLNLGCNPKRQPDRDGRVSCQRS